MAHLQELTTYKEKIMQAICTSDEVVSLLRKDSEPTLSGRDMRYERIFPYDYIPGTTTKESTYICFDIEAPSVYSCVELYLDFYIWIFTHQKLMNTGKGTRIDLLAHAVDKLFNGRDDFGFGKLELKYCKRLPPPSIGYHGKVMAYSAKFFNRMGDSCAGV